MSRSTLIRRASAPVLVGLAGLVLLGACGSDKPEASSYGASPAAAATPISDAPGRELQVVAMDDMFTGATTIPAGMTSVQLSNSGPSPHQVQFLRLHDGVTADQALQAAKAGNPGALLALADTAGGANVVGAGGEQTVTLDLKAGTYLEVCFVPDPDGTPHLAKGMISTLVVTDSADTSKPPTADGAVTLADFSFDLPDPLPSSATLEVVNKGPQPHELTIVKLNDGATADDVSAFFAAPPSGPPPFTYAGGMGALSAGQTGYLDVNLEPGNYAAICLVPDRATHKAHVMLGMIKGFTVES